MTKMASESLIDADRSNGRSRRAVLHLLTGSTFGGAEEHALSILTAISEYGFEPCLAAPAPLIAAMEPELSKAGVKCLALQFSSRLDVLTGARLLKFIRRENIAILHCHLFTASMFGAGIGRMAGVGAVLVPKHPNWAAVAVWPPLAVTAGEYAPRNENVPVPLPLANGV